MIDYIAGVPFIEVCSFQSRLGRAGDGLYGSAFEVGYSTDAEDRRSQGGQQLLLPVAPQKLETSLRSSKKESLITEDAKVLTPV
jgi:hypothetical protein